nr:ribosomal protein L12-related protein [imported] - Neurospora crassa [Neurospora crassa]
MSQQRHSNHGEDVYGLRRSRQQANGVMLEQKNNSSAKRASINSSSLSPRPTPSTKPIADDIGEIALDSTDPMELNDTLSSNNANNPFNEDNLKRSATDDSDEIRMISLSPRKRGTSDSISPLVPTTQISPTEVRIDVDYGSSLTQASEAEGVAAVTDGGAEGVRREDTKIAVTLRRVTATAVIAAVGIPSSP